MSSFPERLFSNPPFYLMKNPMNNTFNTTANNDFITFRNVNYE
jgi:hypothetical protein